MSTRRIAHGAEELEHAAQPLAEEWRDYDALLEMARDKSLVLIGEASHGTHEFYRMRAEITRRLIEEEGFDAVAVEGDWPDVYRVNRFVCGTDGDRDAASALGDFDRFPRWMWRNRDVLDFVEWLEAHNRGRDRDAMTGFYGLDLYSLYRSADRVIAYLDAVDPEAAGEARERYACMGHHGDPQRYGYGVAMGVSEACQREVVAELEGLLRRRGELLQADGLLAEDAYFFAETNARVVRNAESYYRGMFSSRVNTWNLRDQHMAEVLERLQQHLGRQRGRPARVVVWAHNSHLGDARATERARYGELNLGQLVREAAPRHSLLVGFTTFTGHVTAARDWDAPAEHRWVRPALRGGVEHLFEETGCERFFLPLGERAPYPLEQPLLERAIGVIYRPETERQSHYFPVSLKDQFDCVFHLDETRALEPLDLDDRWRRQEPADTYPFGY